MAGLFHLQIVTPDGVVLNQEVEGIILRTTQGDTGILKGHAGYVSAVNAGRVKVNTPQGARIGVASDGFIRVGKKGTTLVATTFIWADAIDVEKTKLTLEDAKQIISTSKDPKEVLIAKMRLKHSRAKLDVALNK